MGLSLLSVVLTPTWAHLPPTPRLLFVVMARTAKDTDRPPRYFGGRDALVLALDGYLADDGRRREDQYRRVRRALEVIKEAGGIRPLNTAHTRQRAEFEICVLPLIQAGQIRPPVGTKEAGKNHPPEAGHIRPSVGPRGGSGVVEEAGQKGPPKEDEELLETEDSLEEAPLPSSSPAHVYAGATSTNGSGYSQRCRICDRPEAQCREVAQRTGDPHQYARPA